MDKPSGSHIYHYLTNGSVLCAVTFVRDLAVSLYALEKDGEFADEDEAGGAESSCEKSMAYCT